MVTRKIKAAILVIFLVFTTVLSTACSEKDGSGYLFRYSLLGDPKILDPQLAEDTSSLLVIENMFCGLFKTTEGGKLAEGVSYLNYTTSSGGLKYTFTLKKDFYWINSDSDFKVQVTAHDFVFAFQRLMNQNTRSPYASDFFCIKNAEKVYTGELDAAQLGVKADGDYTLEFELEYTNANFLYLLTTSSAMPCNQAFFESTKGKYGLEVEASASNGAFYLNSWQYDPYGTNNYLIMRKNKYYAQVYPVFPSSLNFFTEKTLEKVEKDYIDGATDVVVSDGSNKKLFKSGYTVDAYETKSVGLVFNSGSEVFSDLELRQALSFSIDRSGYDAKLSENAKSAYAIIPAGITMLNKSYRELVSENDKSPYNLDLALELWNHALAVSGKRSIDSINIMVPVSFQQMDWLKYITQQWQNKLEFFCGIEPVSNAEYLRRLSSGEYEIALYQLSFNYNSPEAVLNNFKTDDSNNRIHYTNLQVDILLEQSGKAENLSDCVKLYAEAEKRIIEDYIYTPLFYQKEYLIYSGTIQDLEYNPFTKQIDFYSAKNFN